ncbi:MAG: DNA-processing protein DprA [Candidatus Babeliales bacterium]
MNTLSIVDRVVLHLFLIDGVGYATVTRLLALCEQKDIPFDRLYTFSMRDMELVFGLRQSYAERVVRGLSQTDLVDVECMRAEKHGIKIIPLTHNQYPTMLKEIASPPLVLYVQGEIDVLHHTILAVIGSRKGDNYGEVIVKESVEQLTASRWVIVSGGANGIDTMAHNYTMKFGGKTIVVLGSGLLNITGAERRKLCRDIVRSGGALVSIFSMMTEAQPHHFPMRNRVIAGLSRGCVVVQAAQKSGALITAQYALDQGRELFVFPGRVTCPLSAGCHKLIQEGAKLVTSVYDILVEFEGYAIQRMTVDSKNSKKQCSYASTSLEARILKVCEEPMTSDDLADFFDISMGELTTALWNLQNDRLIEQRHTGQWFLIY